jgi:hypothetical protein
VSGETTKPEDVRQILYTLIRTLASGTGPLKSRLRAGFTTPVLTLRSEHFPWPDLGARWNGVMDELAPDNRPQVVLDSWWDFELSRIAQEIVDIFDEVARRSNASM